MLNIVKDFGEYLVRNKLKVPHQDRPEMWIERLGKKVEKIGNLTFEENYYINESWLTELQELQKKYGYDYDLFGSYLEQTNKTNHKNGQFFTPIGVAKLTSMTSMLTLNELSKNLITVADECCGTGRMMIAHSIAAKEKFVNISPIQYLYYNKDIDYKCFIFSTLNAILRNKLSQNVWGDCLAVTEEKTIFTYPSSAGRAIWFNNIGFTKTVRLC